MKYTDTTIFMLPTIKLKYTKKQLDHYGFINAFSFNGEEKDNEYNDMCHIFVAFDPPNEKAFEKICHEKGFGDMIVERYEVGENIRLLVFPLKSEFEEDYKKIREGKYSKTSDKFKTLFPTHVDTGVFGERNLSLQWKIFRKHHTLREFWEKMTGVKFKEEQELWRMWDNERETYYISKVMQVNENTKN